MSALPLLDPAEHAGLQDAVGRKLTNDEAQLLRRELVLMAAFVDWLEGRAVVESARRLTPDGAE